MFSQIRDWYIATIGFLLIAGGLYFASQQASDSGAKNPETKQTADVGSAPEAGKAPNSQSGSTPQPPPKANATPAINPASSSVAAVGAQNAAPAAHNHAPNTPQTNTAQAPAAAPTAAPASQTGSNVGTPALIAGGDPAAGRLVFRKCQVCHSLEPGKDILGPSLAGVFGRKS